jgi:hypothetical protein
LPLWEYDTPKKPVFINAGRYGFGDDDQTEKYSKTKQDSSGIGNHPYKLKLQIGNKRSIAMQI